MRAARPADAPELTRIARAAKAHWGYPDAWLVLWREGLTVNPAEFETQCFLVAEAASEADRRGFAAVDLGDGEAELTHLWVAPEYMGTGVGRHLFRAAVSHCRGAGCGRLRIEADPNAAPFYAHMGAREVGAAASVPAPRMLPVFELTIEAVPVAASVQPQES